MACSMLTSVRHADPDACLTGLDRGRVGDIVVNGERGAHIIVASDIVQYLEDNLTQVHPSASHS